jgi:hypothetical protein
MKPQSHIQDPAILLRIAECKLIILSSFGKDHHGSRIVFQYALDELESMIPEQEFREFCEVELLHE